MVTDGYCGADQLALAGDAEGDEDLLFLGEQAEGWCHDAKAVLESIERCCDGTRRKADTSSVTGRIAAPVAGGVGWHDGDWAIGRLGDGAIGPSRERTRRSGDRRARQAFGGGEVSGSVGISFQCLARMKLL
ncbi:MAG: hypothetical protein FRX48_00111 [Lasallia pustulata]|uniref:Uncharacterized protein n=1 Tax=Lasallia pustulata TaxID=136370 RepID=A0A5M8PZW0_9LECA|nr:MAG: hypothetical protein FRX48_00111 [Lasallia pustulata]